VCVFLSFYFSGERERDTHTDEALADVIFSYHLSHFFKHRTRFQCAIKLTEKKKHLAFLLLRAAEVRAGSLGWGERKHGNVVCVLVFFIGMHALFLFCFLSSHSSVSSK